MSTEPVLALTESGGTPALRIAICDDDPFTRDMVESIAVRLGHEVVGLADSLNYAVALIKGLRPDVVIMEVGLYYNSDFDLIRLAGDVGATAISFSRTISRQMLQHCLVTPWIVEKPDLAALEHVLGGLERGQGPGPAGGDDGNERRRRPARSAPGRPASGLEDAQAFFEAINDAREGDALVAFDVPVHAIAVAADAVKVMRGTDRLLAFPTSVRFFLAGGGAEGIRSMLRRMDAAQALPQGCKISAIIVADGEGGRDAFDRLKHTPGTTYRTSAPQPAGARSGG